jgi:diaminohydroxyphosphoribosylaminopyrimidine deaminase/5-amino-6-(5-phosphoribosylamino)uracil reductase
VPPRRVVFAGSRRLPLEGALARTARRVPTIVIGPLGPDADALRASGIELVPSRTLAEGLGALRDRGIESVVVEGGGRLAGALLGDRLVDRFVLIVSPVWLGDHGVPATRGLEVPSLMHADRWTLVDRKGLGQDTLLTYDRS